MTDPTQSGMRMPSRELVQAYLARTQSFSSAAYNDFPAGPVPHERNMALGGLSFLGLGVSLCYALSPVGSVARHFHEQAMSRPRLLLKKTLPGLFLGLTAYFALQPSLYQCWANGYR
jgi:hypothetical protein